jgi:hypothetical protein
MLRWLEDVQNDLREVKIRRVRQKSNNREQEAFVVKDAKVSEDRGAKESAQNVWLLASMPLHRC